MTPAYLLFIVMQPLFQMYSQMVAVLK